MTNISEYARICKDTHITGENITDFNILDTIYDIETNFDARLYSKNNEIVCRLGFNPTSNRKKQK